MKMVPNHSTDWSNLTNIWQMGCRISINGQLFFSPFVESAVGWHLKNNQKINGMKIFLICIASFVSSALFGQVPTLISIGDEWKQPLELSKLDVQVEVVGNIATTTFDMLFFNPQPRDMEGELSLPLSEGQEICRYALEINGKLREGVIIEKVKARQAFEAITRRNVDPGIVNLTKGNFFKTRIYPVPAKGTKRVVLALSETLTGDEDQLHYTLPIAVSDTIGAFSLDVQVIKSSPDQEDNLGSFQNVRFDNRRDAYVLSLERKHFMPTAPIQFTVPRFGGADHQLFTYDFEGETYFYLNARPPVLSGSERTHPRKIGIYWDRSSSGEKRDLEKELRLLQRYLESLPKLKEVTLTTFGMTSDPEKSFGNDVSAFMTYLRSIRYDGATRLDQLRFPKGMDEFWLFSDGIQTIGGQDISWPAVPVHTLTSSQGSDYGYLKRLAVKTNGAFLNLSKTTVPDALATLQADEEKLLSVDFNENELTEVYPNHPQRVGHFVELAGILRTEKANLQINYGQGGEVTQRQTYVISKQTSAPVSRIWASKKIAYLNLDYSRHQETIRALGQKHRIITKNSSFIVLDWVEDYVAYEIEPPAELKKEYDRLMAKKDRSEPDLEDISQRNLERISVLKLWYESPPKVAAHQKGDASGVMLRTRQDEAFDIEVTEESVVEEMLFMEEPEAESMSDEMEFGSADDDDFASDGDVMVEETPGEGQPSIKVLAWLPDAPYLDRLRSTDEAALEEVYFELKLVQSKRPAFFIQVADFFYEKGYRALATRILSNTIELDLENPELLRVVAKRLLDEGEPGLSVAIFEEINNLRPDEPQSLRDLALAHWANDQYQEALDLFHLLLSRPWVRFEEIKSVVLNEMNNLISHHKNQLDLSGISEDLIVPMPLDVRIVIDWSSNDSDIDLWVIDPKGEKCYYSHPHTAMGGKISQDFTQGYGPEEFTLRNAGRGFYTVYVNYFSESRQTITGPVTIYATMYTHYGTPQEQVKSIAVQVTDQKESRQIAQLEFVE